MKFRRLVVVPALSALSGGLRGLFRARSAAGRHSKKHQMKTYLIDNWFVWSRSQKVVVFRNGKASKFLDMPPLVGSPTLFSSWEAADAAAQKAGLKKYSVDNCGR
jgi:hypothetical protein